MRLIISGVTTGAAKDIINTVVDTFNRIDRSKVPVIINIEGEKSDA